MARAHRRYAAWHVPRSGLVLHALVPAVIEQKVTGQEAFGGYRVLVHRFGSRAPGPGEARKLWVAPDAATWAAVPSWEWLRASVDGARSATAVRAAKVGRAAGGVRRHVDHGRAGPAARHTGDRGVDLLGGAPSARSVTPTR